jgi:hypothetical protein
VANDITAFRYDTEEDKASAMAQDAIAHGYGPSVANGGWPRLEARTLAMDVALYGSATKIWYVLSAALMEVVRAAPSNDVLLAAPPRHYVGRRASSHHGGIHECAYLLWLSC